jgi:F-type H+-transporting ATPase subunit b
MPQLAQLSDVYQSQWFWLLLVLGAIYLFVGRGIVPKVEATVDARDARIAADLAAAESARDAADKTEEAWRKKINDAHADAVRATAEAKAVADRDAEKRVKAADSELAKKADMAAASLAEARTSALAEIEAVAADAARDIVAKLTGTSVGAAEAQQAVAGALRHG